MRLPIDNNLLSKCIKIAASAHFGQVYERGIYGEPYILHPLRVMQNVAESPSCDPIKKILVKSVAVLHDVMEDTAWSEQQLTDADMLPEEIMIPLRLLTHKKTVPYEVYIENLCINPIANLVKFADVSDNNFHLPQLADRDKAFRLRIKYNSARDFIMLHGHYDSCIWLTKPYEGDNDRVST